MSHEFSVWAPLARRVSLVVEEERIEMSRAEGDPSRPGWWRCRVPEAGHGTRYGFSLDHGPVRPDPRSPSQPDGVNALSELIGPGFAWTDAQWRGLSHRGMVLYELHVGTFSPEGTFEGAIDRLDHLVELGVNAVELLPVAEYSGDRGWGYDGVDLFAPHHAYGGPEGLRRLVDACHARSLGVVLDVVYNHLGPVGNYLAEFGPYFSERHQTNWGPAVNFDGPGSDEVRRFVVDNARMWLADYHVDGLRLDAVHAIADESARHILEELELAVDALAAHVRRPLFLIAESDLNDPRLVRDRLAGGYGLAAAWADDWHHAVHATLTGERGGYYEDFGSLELLAKALRQAWVYDGTWSPHRRRHYGRPPTGLAGYQFVVCTQNHDQVGNRALGERTSALMSEGRCKVAAALLLTSPFTPLLFQGEEWGASTPFLYFTDHRDARLGQAVSAGRRSEFAAFGWDPGAVPDPQSRATFEASRPDWTELERSPHRDLLDWYRRLLALRRRHPALSDPHPESIEVVTDEKRGTLVVRRGRGPDALVVLVNLGEEPHEFKLERCPDTLEASDPGVSVRTVDRAWAEQGAPSGFVVTVPPDAVVIAGPTH